jgi:hypothetical protein
MVLLGGLCPEVFIALILYSSFVPVGWFVNLASFPPAAGKHPTSNFEHRTWGSGKIKTLDKYEGKG